MIFVQTLNMDFGWNQRSDEMSWRGKKELSMTSLECNIHHKYTAWCQLIEFNVRYTSVRPLRNGQQTHIDKA